MLRHKALTAAWLRYRFAIAVCCILTIGVARLLSNDTRVYEVRTDRGIHAFDDLNKRWGWSFVYLELRARILAKYPNFAIEHRQLIGPGNATAANLRALRIAAWLRGLAFTVLLLTLLRALAEKRFFRLLFANTAPGLFVTVVMLVVGAGGFEIYQRAVNHAFGDGPLPMRFDPIAGLMYEPNAEVRWTNQMDFWTRERTNSLGFLDWEPAQPKPPGRFRVMLVGDSFIEAAQVTNDAKIQTLLASRFDEQLGTGRTDVVSIGLSGTGQANQIGLYETRGKALAPDLVVLFAVSNDFADNSPLLSAVRMGWSPAHPCWFFFERMGANQFRPIPVADDWWKFKLPGADPVAYHAALMQDPGYASRFGDWKGPADVDVDSMFFRRELPPAFEDAIALTGHAIQEWKRIAVRDRFKLAVVATSTLTRGKMPTNGTLYLSRFREIVEKAGLPFLDLYPTFANQPNPSRGQWRHDGHWTRTGHQWAAAAVYRFLTDSGLLPDATLASVVSRKR